MDTEDDGELMTDEEWRKELHAIVWDVSEYLNRTHGAYVKNADGEVSLDTEGHYEFKRIKKTEPVDIDRKIHAMQKERMDGIKRDQERAYPEQPSGKCPLSPDGGYYCVDHDEEVDCNGECYWGASE